MMAINDFRRLLGQYAGLAMTDTDQAKLEKFLRNRLAQLKLGKLSRYIDLLAAANPAAEKEWQVVMQALTVPESFFLRDKGQMRILERHILPELIRRHQDSRQLRLWSAGCSTGEEPYSLAMLVQKLLPMRQEWDILILGTDINAKSLATAQAARYSNWSLRDAEPEVLACFRPAADDLFVLDAPIRDQVVFRYANLLQTPFPDDEINRMDLILCRNVFIYFDQAAIAGVLEKFKQTLKPHGYLLTGHGELYQQSLDGLKSHLFAESVVYQRGEKEKPATKTAMVFTGRPQKPVPVPTKKSTLPAVEKKPQSDDAATLNRAYQRGEYAEVLAIAQKQLSQATNFEAHYWSAKAFASLGQYHTAETQIQAALALNSQSARCYYLLAHIKESQNDIQQAKSLLNQVIALDAEFIPAYLELTLLYDQEDVSKHQEMRGHALRLLGKLPPEHYLEDFAAYARDLIQQLH